MVCIRKASNGVAARLRRATLDEDGSTAIEYGLIAALIAISIIGSITAISQSLSTTFDEVKVEIDTTG